MTANSWGSWRSWAALLLLGGLGAAGCGSAAGDPARCAALVTRICTERARCTGLADTQCTQQVTALIPCAQANGCPAGKGYNAGAVDQCETDQLDATCQDLLAGKVATSCTQTCR